jgi:hypothetical protein
VISGRSGRSLIVIVAVTLFAAGCQGQPRGVSIPPGAEDLAPCPVKQIPIGDLAAMGEPGCDLTGASLTFADEELAFAVGPPAADGSAPTLTIPSVGAVFSQGNGDGRELLVVNWGVPGVGVALIEGGRLLAIWASSDSALDLQHQQLAVDSVDFD